MMDSITYDRTEKLYKFVDPETGVILTAPPGKKNKAALFRNAIGMLDPDLYQSAVSWIDDFPELERVVWKGAEIVANSGVETFPGAGVNMVTAKVDSSDEYGRYSLVYQDGGLTCECYHWQEMGAPYDRNGRRVCKHIAAFHLYQRCRENRF